MLCKTLKMLKGYVKEELYQLLLTKLFITLHLYPRLYEFEHGQQDTLVYTLTLQARSLLAKQIVQGWGDRWTPPQDFRYAWTDRL